MANDAGYSYEWVDQVVFDRVIATRSTCDQANCQYIKAEGESQPECTGQGISFFIMDRVCADAELCQATEYNDLRCDQQRAGLTCPPPLNVLKDAYDHSCHCARSDEYQT